MCEDEARSEDDILREFDLNMKYGPSCGMDRLKRYDVPRLVNVTQSSIIGWFRMHIPLRTSGVSAKGILDGNENPG